MRILIGKSNVILHWKNIKGNITVNLLIILY
jgi:hypothetical protein